MKHSYHIEGMTCNGCRVGVEEKLNAVPGVTKADVNLEAKKAVISMNTHVSLKRFQNALPEKYTITEVKQAESGPGNFENNNVFQSTEPEKTKLQQLKPLLIILAYIAAAALLLNYKRDSWNGLMLDFMGLFFIVFSFFKILDLKGFPDSFRMYDPLAKAIPMYA